MKFTSPRLLLAPRHPERFAEVASLLDASGLSWSRRTAGPSPRDETCDAILLDTVGELRAAYPLAEVVFVGGSVAKTGGHNVLEPASAARCVVTGAHTFNFAEIVGDFARRGALVQLPALADAETPAALARVLRELLTDGGRRRRLGDNALALVKQSRGATARTLDFLKPWIEQTTGGRGRGTAHRDQ